MKLWIDDVRPAPEGYVWCSSVNEAIAIIKACGGYTINALMFGEMIYPEHNDNYLRECINLLKEKNAPIDWEKVE